MEVSYYKMNLNTLVLNNIEILGYSHQNNFFGEKSINYSSTKTLSIQGFVLDLQNTVGVKNVFNNATDIKNIAQNFHNIIINGKNFGIGRFISLSFDEGNWVKETRFNADIEIEEVSSLTNLSEEFRNRTYQITATSENASPNILNLVFYQTGFVRAGSFIYFDTNLNYALVRRVSNQWMITSITNILNTFPPRFVLTNSSIEPPVGTYTGTAGFTGSVTLSIISTGLNLNDKRLELIESLEENFQVNFNIDTKNIEGRHSIEIEYKADNKDISVIRLAQKLAFDLLNNTLPSNLSELNYTNRPPNSYTVLNEESYDVIKGKCGFVRTFSYNTQNIDKPYSINRNISFELSEEGVGTVTENSIIKAENNIPSLYENALIGLNEEIIQTFDRCLEVFNVYKNKFNISSSLKSTLLKKSVSINKYDGIINYETSFGTDKKFENQDYIFENILVLNKEEDYIWTAREVGSIIGIGSQNRKYINAENGWTVVKGDISSRVTNFWTNNAKEKASNNLKETTKQISKSPFKGEINYDYSYSDDPTIRTNLGDIKRLIIEYNDNGEAGNKLPPIFQEFIIPRRNYVLVQNRKLLEQGTFSISLTAEIALSNSFSVFNGFNYFNILKTEARNSYFGGNNDKYLESVTFSTDEIEQVVKYEEIYKYS
jgi:hypothetical protein